MPDPQPVIQALASFFFPLLVLLLPVILKLVYPQIELWLQAKAQDAQWAVVIGAARAVVSQVEQLKKQGLIPDNAAAIKWATQALHSWLILRGIDLPIDQLATAIESAVNDLPHSQASPGVPGLPAGKKWE